MFCAKAGARQVIAVDASAIINKARENIFHNGLSEKITCVKGKIEEATLPVEKVDIIVSEWMGYCLLYEAMLPSVFFARDKYLAPDGLVVPSHTNLWIAPVADSEYVADNIEFWRDVYGFDMKAFLHLDLHRAKTEDLVFTKPWVSRLPQDIDALDGFAIWFDTFFAPDRDAAAVPADMTAEEWQQAGRSRVAFTTSPFGQETHWKQGLLLTEHGAISSGAKAGNELHGKITFATDVENTRALALEVVWKGSDNSAESSQKWILK